MNFKQTQNQFTVIYFIKEKYVKNMPTDIGIQDIAGL